MGRLAPISRTFLRRLRLPAACLVGVLAWSGAYAASPGEAPAPVLSPASLVTTDSATAAWPAVAPETPAEPSVAAILSAHAARELDPAEMDKMRGGFLLFSSVAMDVRIEFSALVNGEAVPVVVDPSVFGASGILTRLGDGIATVAGTGQFRGLASSVQNNLSFQDLQTATIATFNLHGSIASFRGGLFRSELNYTTSSLGL